MTREEAARAFAEKMGWTIDIDDSHVTPIWSFKSAKFEMWNPEHNQRIHTYAELPAPDAPLHEHLAFCGRVAEAIYPRRDGQDLDQQVGWVCRALTDSIDPSWSALLAALAALEAK